MINRDHDLSITRQAELLEISRGTVYYLPRPVSPADLALMRELDELHLQHPFMGARMLRESNRNVASIALDVGYGSEAAFARAFKQLMGAPPAAWRRTQSAG